MEERGVELQCLDLDGSLSTSDACAGQGDAAKGD